MQQKTLIKYIKAGVIFNSLFFQSALAFETPCSENPALTQKKMTHIYRSIACSQAQDFKVCEQMAGLEVLAPAAIAGSAALLKTASRFREDNFNKCKYSSIKDFSPIFLYLDSFNKIITGSEAIAAKMPACTLNLASTQLDVTSNDIKNSAIKAITEQTSQIAEQEKIIAELDTAEQKMKKAKADFNELEKHLLGEANKEYSRTIPEIEKEIARLNLDLNKYLETDPTHSKVSDLKSKIAEQKKLKAQLQSEAKRFLNPIALNQLNEANQLKGKAENDFKTLDKAKGSLQEHKQLLSIQQQRLAEFNNTLKVASQRGRPDIQVSTESLRKRLSSIKEAGVLEEQHARAIQNVDLLLADQLSKEAAVNMAKNDFQSRIMATELTRKAGALRSTISSARLGTGAAKFGTKIIGGVVMAAGSVVAMAAELTFHTSGPSDVHCLSDSPQRFAIANLVQFTQENNCQGTPAILKPNEFRRLFDLSGDEQMEYFKNPEFCNWLNEVYKVHAPKINNAKCNSNGVSYENEVGLNIKATWNEQGELIRYDSFGATDRPADHMFSVYFSNGNPSQIGAIHHTQQLATTNPLKIKAFEKLKRSFNNSGFDTEKQNKFNFAKNPSNTTNYKTSYQLQSLALAEIKSCCRSDSPRVEDETCYARYGIKSGTPSSSFENSSFEGSSK